MASVAKIMEPAMTILGRYIGSTLIKATLLVLLVLTGLEAFILLATQLNAVGSGSYSVWQAMLYVLFILPQQTYLLFPMAGLLGILFGLSMLANHSELIIMRAAGVSPMQIMLHSLKAGLILIIIMTFIGEFIAPSATHLAEKRKLIETSSGQALKTRQGMWLRQGNNFCYIKTIYSAHHIANISCYAFNNQQLLTASFADQGNYQHNQWQIENVLQSQIENNHVTTHRVPHTTWNLNIDPRLLRISLSQPEEMSLSQLSDIIAYQKANHLAATNLQIAFWQRVLQPFASIVMMFLAVPFIFGPLRSVTTGLRLLLGVIIGFIFYMCNQLFPPLSQVLGFPPLLAVMLPILLFATVGVVLLQRVR
jgi:lipopolysaccharide export system permease protein